MPPTHSLPKICQCKSIPLTICKPISTVDGRFTAPLSSHGKPLDRWYLQGIFVIRNMGLFGGAFDGFRNHPFQSCFLRNGLCVSRLLANGDHKCTDFQLNGKPWEDIYHQDCARYTQLQEPGVAHLLWSFLLFLVFVGLFRFPLNQGASNKHAPMGVRTSSSFAQKLKCA